MSGPIGKRTPYIEAVQKVTGQAQFAEDFHFSNMLYVKFLRSPHTHAKIQNINLTKAKKLAGVCAISTGSDLPIPFGVLPISPDETAMAVNKVRYIGEIVAAVAAESEKIAHEACSLIDVDYEPIKDFLEPDDSLIDCSPDEQIHSHSKNGTNVHK
ncbi:MAG: aldehyde oxidase, partial [Desulfobacula sp.]|nr:aldehyde oxidase [Desulfobacula sp.]